MNIRHRLCSRLFHGICNIKSEISHDSSVYFHSSHFHYSFSGSEETASGFLTKPCRCSLLTRIEILSPLRGPGLVTQGGGCFLHLECAKAGKE